MQQDWRRDPIWQLLSIIIGIVVTLITQFNDPTLKIAIAITGAAICGWIYFGNEQLKRLLKHPVVVIVFKLLCALLFLLLCFMLFFLCVGLFFRADNFWGKIAAGAGGVFAFSAAAAIYRNEHPFIASVFKYAGFITGVIGIILVLVVENPWLKVILGIGAVFVEILTFALFAEKDIAKTFVPQKLDTSTVPSLTKQPVEPEGVIKVLSKKSEDTEKY